MFLMGGDFNAKNRCGGCFRALEQEAPADAVQSSSAEILATGQASHIPYALSYTQSAIDFFIYNGLHPDGSSISPEYQLSSDHIPLVVGYDCFPKSKTIKGHLLPRGANIAAFRRNLEETLDLN